MEGPGPKKLSTNVGWETTVSVMQMSPHDEPYQIWPTRGRLYLCGVRCIAKRDAHLRLTIRHPVTKEPLPGMDRIPATALDTDHPHCRQRFGQDPTLSFVWLSARHDPENLEPFYCEEGLPLIVEAEGAAPLRLIFQGSDHYRVYGFVGSCPHYSGELREPFVPGVTPLGPPAPALGDLN